MIRLERQDPFLLLIAADGRTGGWDLLRIEDDQAAGFDGAKA